MTYPQRFGPYVLERFLAAGGMAEVFVARQMEGGSSSGRVIRGPIALKRMLPAMMENAEYAGMFRDEAALASKLVHPNIVRVYDSGEYDGRLYMAMELIDGLDAASLQKKLRSKSEMLGLPHALRIGVELCSGLAAAHSMKDERGVALMLIHRDVSPQNILIGRDGVVKVTDFGVAKATGRETHTATGNIKGKIPYMAPEQALAQQIDQRVDQFAAGIVVWELLTGTRLFHDKNDLLMFEKIIRRPTPKPSSVRAGIPAGVDNAVLRALSKNPDERFADVGAFGRALQKSLDALGGHDASDLAPIVEYVLGPAPPAGGAVVEQPKSQQSSRAQSRPTGQPIPAAQQQASQQSEVDGDDVATMALPGLSGPTRPAPNVATVSRPRAVTGAGDPLQRHGGSGNDATVLREQSRPSSPSSSSLSSSASSSFSVPQSQASAPALTLDRSRMRVPVGVESHTQTLPAPGSTGMLTPAEPRAFPVVAVAIALVVGLGAGFGIAKATSSAPPVQSNNGCARPSAASADVEAAYDLLLKSQMELEAGDLSKAAQRASEAQVRSGTAKGHYMLGKIRMQSGDVGAALTHYRCVIEMAPGSDEAKSVTRQVVK